MLLLLMWGPASARAGEDVVLGILEDVPRVYAGEGNLPGVRIVFQKHGNDWQSFPSNCSDQNCLTTVAEGYPRAIVWTVTFNGRKLGKVKGVTPKAFHFYSHIGLQEIIDGSVPTVGKRSVDYGGFTDSAVYRPLVANSKPYFKNPESWKRSQPAGSTSKLLRAQFRKKFPAVSNCVGETIIKSWTYRDADIKIVKAYSSNKGWIVAQLQLSRYGCDGPQDDAFVDQWFAVSPAQAIRFLGAGMWLVDAGDYDNDGACELVFSINRYNRGGYELFYDNFKKHVEFQFSYH